MGLLSSNVAVMRTGRAGDGEGGASSPPMAPMATSPSPAALAPAVAARLSRAIPRTEGAALEEGEKGERKRDKSSSSSVAVATLATLAEAAEEGAATAASSSLCLGDAGILPPLRLEPPPLPTLMLLSEPAAIWLYEGSLGIDLTALAVGSPSRS
jgi:hypothetical protein